MEKIATFLILTMLYCVAFYTQTVNWTETRPAGDADKNWNVGVISSNGSAIVAGIYSGRIYISTNSGSNWTETQPAGNVDEAWNIVSLSSNGSIIIAGTLSGRLYISTNTGSNWTEAQPAGATDKNWYCSSMSLDGARIIVGEGNTSSSGGRVYISTDNGTSWTETLPAGSGAFKNWYCSAMSSNGSKIIVGEIGSLAAGGRLYMSTNSGSSWFETRPAGDSNLKWNCTAMSSDGTSIIAGVNLGRLYISTNSGSSWGETQPAGNSNKAWSRVSMSSNGSIVMAGVGGITGGRLYISTNSGNSWSETIPAGATNKNWYIASMNSDGSKGIAGAYSGRLYLNNDPFPIELSSFNVIISGRDVILKWQTETEIQNYGFDIERTFFTKQQNESKVWEKIGFIPGNGNSNSPKSYEFIDRNPVGGCKFAYRLKQIDSDGIFEYSDAVEIEVIPHEFELFQNYPNPFNPTTKIKFSVPNQSELRIDLYNMIGEIVKTLAEGKYETGNYEIDLDMSNLSSGIYLYKMQSNGFVKVRKLLLMK